VHKGIASSATVTDAGPFTLEHGASISPLYEGALGRRAFAGTLFVALCGQRVPAGRRLRGSGVNAVGIYAAGTGQRPRHR